jgi:phospholipase C
LTGKSRWRRFLLTITIVILILLVPWLTGVYIAGSTNGSAGSKIKHIIFIVQENHSFDNYFGTYPHANGIPAGLSVPVNLTLTSSPAPESYVLPFSLSDSQPILLYGDELKPGVAAADEVSMANNSSQAVSSFSLGGAPIPDQDHSWKAMHLAYDNGKMDGFVAAQLAQGVRLSVAR